MRKDSHGKEKHVARINTLQKDSIFRKMPDTGAANYIVVHFLRCGEAMLQGMGDVMPTLWSEIQAYGSIFNLSKFEMQCLREMSESYVHAKKTLDNDYSQPPYCEDEDKALAERRDTVSKKLQDASQAHKVLKL